MSRNVNETLFLVDGERLLRRIKYEIPFAPCAFRVVEASEKQRKVQQDFLTKVLYRKP